MKAPPRHAAEAERLAALRRAEILDTPPEQAFDDLAHLARTACKAKAAVISLVDEDRVWFKSRIDLDAKEIPRDLSFCGHAIIAEDILVIRDAREDERFFDNPLVIAGPHIRAYAGVPILTPEGYPLGTVGVIDLAPRDLEEDQADSLHRLARQIAAQIELRRTSAAVAASMKEALTAKMQLEAERALLQGVLGGVTEYAIIGTDLSGTITLFNEGAERMLGYRAAEVIGRATPEMWHDRIELEERAAELGIAPGLEVLLAPARRGEPETREWTCVRKDGRAIPVSVTATTMRDGAGALSGFIAIARDVTRERFAEQARARLLVERAAREAAERAADRLTQLQALASALAEALTPAQVIDVIVNQSTKALAASTGAVALLRDDDRTLDLVAFSGLTREMLGALFSFPISTPLPISDAILGGAPVMLERVDADSRYAHLLAAPRSLGDSAIAAAPFLLNGRSLGAVALTFDGPRAFKEEDRIFMLALGRLCAQALERARLYEAEALARTLAESANRAKDDFLSMLSHELRTPLTSVLGWAHILLTRADAATLMVRGITIIQRNALAQLRLIEDILDVSRIVAGKLELKQGEIALAPIVQAAVEAARPAAESARLSLASAIDPLAGSLIGDADRVQQVVGNLISNAVKFTPAGGHIEVRLDRLDGRARILVTDSGAGIAPDFLPHVFERFRQADQSPTREHGGLGIGLWIAKNIVERHGGRITAESPGRDRGATFTVHLPIYGGR